MDKNQQLTGNTGMQHGPFPPPQLDQEPQSAQWIMEEAGGDPALYQLLRLRESLEIDRKDNMIEDTVYDQNKPRLEREIHRQIANSLLPTALQELENIRMRQPDIRIRKRQR